jgi:hypothetical protein
MILLRLLLLMLRVWLLLVRLMEIHGVSWYAMMYGLCGWDMPPDILVGRPVMATVGTNYEGVLCFLS